MAMSDPLMPYQYSLVWVLMHEGGLTAGELAHTAPVRHWNASPLAMANRLRPLVARGWLEVEDGIYRATARARAAMSV
jgi:hypothetical protein